MTTSTEKIVTKPNKAWPQIMAVMSCYMCQFSTGCTVGWISPSLIKLQDPNSPIPTSLSQGSTIASITVIGGVIAPILFAYKMDKIGRKWMAFFACAFFALSWVTLIFSTEVWHIYIARIFVGFGNGYTFGIVPMYIGEVSEKHLRSWISIGATILSLLGSLTFYSVGPYIEFQTMNIIGLIFPLIGIVAFTWMPESPYHLVRQGQRDEAVKVMMKIRGHIDCENVEEEMAIIDKFVEMSPKRPYKEIVKELGQRSNLMAIAILTLVMVSQQFSGLPTLKTYFHIIIIETETPLDPDITVIVVEVIGILVTLSAMFFVEKYGRKFLFLVSSAGSIVSSFVTGLYFMLKSEDIIGKEFSWMALAGLFSLQVFTSFGLSPIPTIIASEMSSASIRSWFGGYKSITLSIFNAISSKVFQIIKDGIGAQYAFWMFCLILLVCWVLLFIIMPETKGKTFPEIQEKLAKRRNKPEKIAIENMK